MATRSAALSTRSDDPGTPSLLLRVGQCARDSILGDYRIGMRATAAASRPLGRDIADRD